MKTIAKLLLFLLIASSTWGQTNLAQHEPVVGGGRVIVPGFLSSQPGESRDGDDILGQTYNQTQCGLNYVSSSLMITTRYSPPGAGLPATFPISGIPPCVSPANILKAYVWWVVSYNIGSSLTPTIDITNPNSVTNNYNASLAGSSGPKCWGEAGTRTFRADVTSNITGNGNYVININGNPVTEIDGITLLIIYRDPTATYQGTFIIYDGCLSYQNSIPATQDIQNFTACDNSTVARGFTITSDQQNNIAASHSCTINSTASTFPNNFWNFDEANTNITVGQTTSTFGVTPASGDCWCWAAMGLYYETANCTTCTPINSMSLSFQNVDATCGQNNGSSSITVNGGVPPYSYTWSTTPPQTTSTATGLGAGTYTVTVTDNSGCGSATATVTINSVGAMNISTTTTNVLCNGATTGAATVTVNSGGSPPFSYAWSTTPIQTSSSASNLNAGTYVVTVTDNVNCTVTASVLITQPPALSISFTNFSHTTCGDANGAISPTYSGGVAPYNYSWSNSQTTASVNNLAAGTYTVTITDANSCTGSSSFVINPSAPPTVQTTGDVSICQGNSTTLGATGANAYSWSPSATLSSSTGNSVTATPLVTTTYQVVGTDLIGCTDTAYVTVTVNPLPFVFTPPAPSICSGGTVNVSVSGADHYHWSPLTGVTSANGPDSTSVNISLTSTTTYTVTGYTLEGCSGSATVTVVVNPNPQPVITSIGNPVFCDGSSVILQPLVINASDSYHWNPGGQTTQQITVTQSGTFTLTVNDANGCAGTSPPFTVTVNPNPVATITPAGPVLICTNSPATLSANTGPGYSYQWYFNSTMIVGATNSQYSTSVTGTYSVQITDANGCTGVSNNVQVMQGSGPAVTIVSPPPVGCLQNTIYIGYGPQDIQLCAQAAAGAASYLWSTGATTQCINVNTPGVYTVTAYDINGCPSPTPAVLNQPINIIDIRCGHGLKKILLCHVPEGNQGNPQTLCIGPPAISPHLSMHRYDCLGPCSLYYRSSEIVEAENFFVFTRPNPFNNRFTLEILSVDNSSVLVNIYDVLGRNVESYNDVTEQTMLGVNLKTGVYFAEVIQGNNRQMIQIIKSE